MASLQQVFSLLRQAASSRGLSLGKSAWSKERRRLAERRAPLRALYNHEIRVRCAAQEVGLGTYELDCHSGQIHCSFELKGILGLSQQEEAFSLKRMEESIHPSERVRVMSKLKAALDPRGDGELNEEYRLLRPDGLVAWVRIKGRTFFAGEGSNRRPLGATGIVMDVTEWKLAEAALALREKHFDQAVRGANIGIWNWDLRTGEIAWSERCRQLFGFPPGEPVSQEQFLEALHPDDRDRTVAAMKQAMDRRQEYSIEYRVKPGGKIRWIQTIGSTLFDEKTNTAISVSGIALDITERKFEEEALRDSHAQVASRAEQDRTELGEAHEALESTNLEMQQFAYIAAHDMQTPLRSITGFAQLLQKEYRGRPLDAQAELWLERLVSASHRMHGLIQDLLTYSGMASLGRPFQAPT